MKHLRICLGIVLIASYWTLHSQDLVLYLNQLTQSLVLLKNNVQPQAELTHAFIQELINKTNYYDQTSVETTLRYLIQYKQIPGHAEAFPSEVVVRRYEWIHLLARALANDIVSASTRLTNIHNAEKLLKQLKEKVYEVRSDVLNLTIKNNYNYIMSLASSSDHIPVIILNNLCQSSPKDGMQYIVPLLLGDLGSFMPFDLPKDIKNCVISLLATLIENGQKNINQNWYNSDYIGSLLQIVRFYLSYSPDTPGLIMQFMGELARYQYGVNLGIALSPSINLLKPYYLANEINAQRAIDDLLNKKISVPLSNLPFITLQPISYNDLQNIERSIALTALLNTLCTTKTPTQLQDLTFIIVQLEELQATLPKPDHLPRNYNAIEKCIKNAQNYISKRRIL